MLDALCCAYGCFQEVVSPVEGPDQSEPQKIESNSYRATIQATLASGAFSFSAALKVVRVIPAGALSQQWWPLMHNDRGTYGSIDLGYHRRSLVSLFAHARESFFHD